jgi:hypothetical protein
MSTTGNAPLDLIDTMVSEPQTNLQDSRLSRNRAGAQVRGYGDCHGERT